MAMDVTSLSLNVTSDTVTKSAAELDKLTKSSKKAEKATDGLEKASKKAEKTTDKYKKSLKEANEAAKKGAEANKKLSSSMAVLSAKAAVLFGALAGIKKAFSSTVELEDYRAQLKTATGSVENASEAFSALEQFAAATPYALNQSLEAFIKLTNLGLTPSEAALESYGNTASAMGKSMMQLIEAVADATTGEFERLKEFGIKSKSEGDRVSFTFRGMTTTIGKNAAEIEAYLMSLGQNEFAGAMADRMNTLGGMVSNLEDSWDKLFRTISEHSPIGNAIKSTVQVGIDALNSLEAAIKGLSGADTPEINRLVANYDRQVSIQKSPSNDRRARAAGSRNLRSATSALEGFSEAEIAVARLENSIVSLGEKEIELNRILEQKVRRRSRRTDERRAQTKAELAATEAQIVKSEKEVEILKEKVKQERKARLEAEMKKKLEEKAAAQPKGDRLAKFKIKPQKSAASVTSATTSTSTKSSGDFEGLVEELKAEEILIQESYLRRNEIILKNTEAGSKERFKLQTQNQQRYEEELEYLQQRTIREVDIRRNGFMLELDQIKEHFKERREMILTNEQLTEKEKNDLTIKLAKERNDTLMRMEMVRTKQGLSIANDYFSNFTWMAESNNKKMKRIGKAALRAQKITAIAQTTMKTYESATSAFSAMAGIPYVGPVLGGLAAGAAIAAGLANVAQIKATGFKTGGYTGGGGVSDVAGVVHGQEFVMDAKNTARNRETLEKMHRGEKIESGTSSSGMKVYINNHAGVDVKAKQMSNNELVVTIKEVVNTEVPMINAREFADPNSRSRKSLGSNTNIQGRTS